ncbi:hypothetical protein [Bradyrhizobium sp. CCBAU 21362]|uniref:hypothetical protein n=1 Tax=Bradyrhizobium sp. CCBAU 21362 TaxID=1325082 RepID=UPI002305FE41|nr:hypothetical protein [Bradyrhizobium sp. CCBAU 21362]
MAATPKNPSLYSRMQAHGTLTEAPRDVPDARFALPSSIHWMRALAILAADQNVDFAVGRTFYAKVQARSVPDRELNTVCEQLLFVLNQIAALQALTSAPNKADVARTAIVAWYYGVYSAASAMTAAMDGSFQDIHTETARKWQERFPANHLAMPPFSDCLSSVLPATAEAELAPVRARGRHSLVNAPSTAREAWGCCAEYLSGTAGWERWNVEERVRETGAFKALGVSDFRKKAARDLRDAAYARRGIAFLHQASRYRGKANYRDAIFLAYGNSVPAQLSGFIDDLLGVLKAFAAMAGAYCSLRVGRAAWTDFVNDLDRKKAISVSPKDIW